MASLREKLAENERYKADRKAHEQTLQRFESEKKEFAEENAKMQSYLKKKAQELNRLEAALEKQHKHSSRHHEEIHMVTAHNKTLLARLVRFNELEPKGCRRIWELKRGVWG